MPLLNSAIPLFAFAALVISEDCCSVASLNYSMPPLLSVTLCRCYAHIFFTLPLLSVPNLARLYLCRAVPCFALAIITWRFYSMPLPACSLPRLCYAELHASPQHSAVAARGFSQLGFAVASQCNALRALPLHNSSLPSLYQSSPSQVMS